MGVYMRIGMNQVQSQGLIEGGGGWQGDSYPNFQYCILLLKTLKIL